MEWILVSWPMLILLGLGLWMALRLNYGARGPDPDDPVYVLLNITSWVLVGMGLAPAVFFGILTFMGVIVLVLAVVTLVEVILQRRAAQRRSICTLLSLMTERGAQLESSVIMAGQSFRGIAGRAAKRLLDTLQEGVPLPAAVMRNPAALPAEASAYLAAGQTASARSAALRELGRGEQRELATSWRAYVDRVSYLSAVIMMMIVVMTFVMYKIVPEYEKIFHEFNVELPGITQAAISLSNAFVQYWALPVAWVLLVMLVILFVVGICYLCDLPVLNGIGDRLFSGRRSADVLRILAIAVEQREPLADVLQRVGLVYPSALTRQRVTDAASAVSSGADWREGLRTAEIISRADCGLLQTAERVGNLPWALRAIADRREKRSAYLITAMLHIVYPLTIVALGVLVAFFVTALFIPIVKLINSLAV